VPRVWRGGFPGRGMPTNDRSRSRVLRSAGSGSCGETRNLRRLGHPPPKPGCRRRERRLPGRRSQGMNVWPLPRVVEIVSCRQQGTPCHHRRHRSRAALSGLCSTESGLLPGRSRKKIPSRLGCGRYGRARSRPSWAPRRRSIPAGCRRELSLPRTPNLMDLSPRARASSAAGSRTSSSAAESARAQRPSVGSGKAGREPPIGHQRTALAARRWTCNGGPMLPPGCLAPGQCS